MRVGAGVFGSGIRRIAQRGVVNEVCLGSSPRLRSSYCSFVCFLVGLGMGVVWLTLLFLAIASAGWAQELKWIRQSAPGMCSSRAWWLLTGNRQKMSGNTHWEGGGGLLWRIGGIEKMAWKVT